MLTRKAKDGNLYKMGGDSNLYAISFSYDVTFKNSPLQEPYFSKLILVCDFFSFLCSSMF